MKPLKKPVLSIPPITGWPQGVNVLLVTLANIPDLAALRGVEKRALVRAAKKARIPGSSIGLVTRAVPPESAHAWGLSDSPSFEWDAMWIAHPHARKLHALFEGQSVEFPIQSEGMRIRPYSCHRKGERTFPPFLWHEYGDRQYCLLRGLLDALRAQTCPFRRCPRCASFFLSQSPTKQRTYCSSQCTHHANEARRKERPRRQADVRKNMKKYREKLRRTGIMRGAVDGERAGR